MRQMALTCIPNTMKMVVLLAFVLAMAFPAVKSAPNTKFTKGFCNIQSYTSADPYASNVAHVLAELMTVTPSRQGYSHYTVSPSKTDIAYGHATCSLNLARSECADCLASAKAILTSRCHHKVGAQVTLVDCFMRYENYPFA